MGRPTHTMYIRKAKSIFLAVVIVTASLLAQGSATDSCASSSPNSGCDRYALSPGCISCPKRGYNFISCPDRPGAFHRRGSGTPHPPTVRPGEVGLAGGRSPRFPRRLRSALRLTDRTGTHGDARDRAERRARVRALPARCIRAFRCSAAN